MTLLHAVMQNLPKRCAVVIILRHERCSLDLSHLVAHLREAGLWDLASRVVLRVDGWHGPLVDFGHVEVGRTPSAYLCRNLPARGVTESLEVLRYGGESMAQVVKGGVMGSQTALR